MVLGRIDTPQLNNPDQTPQLAIRRWLEAAGNTGLLFRLKGADRKRWGIHYYLREIALAQYGADLAFRRIGETAEDRKSETSHHEELAAIATGHHDVHAFLVASHLYWRLTRCLGKLLPPELISKDLDRFKEAIQQTKTARDHIEHLDERVSDGRPEKWGGAMEPAEFRCASGIYTAVSVQFGSELFDLRLIAEAIVDSSALFSRRISQASSLNATVTTRPSDVS